MEIGMVKEPMTVHYAVDVGSTRQGNLGWARATGSPSQLDVVGGADFDALLASIKNDLSTGFTAISIGFECPLFLPVPRTSAELGTGRIGDRDRSCFASAGSSVATLGLHQFAFLCQALKSEHAKPTLDWAEWKPDPRVVLIWEAFVSGKAKGGCESRDRHMRDAAAAAIFVDSALTAARTSGNCVRVQTETVPISLAGLALIWSGWSADVALLSRDVLVVKPETTYSGPIRTTS